MSGDDKNLMPNFFKYPKLNKLLKDQPKSYKLSIYFSSFAVLLFLSVALILPFKDKVLSLFFLKPFSHAAGPAPLATDWPQLQYNAQHIGRTAVQVNPNYQATWVWMDKTHIVKNFVSASGKSITDNFPDKATFKSTIIFAGQMQPITVGGKTFFGAMNGTMYAVNSLTGDNLWDYTTGGAILSTAAYDNGVVIVPAMDGKLYGINSTNGLLSWSFTTGAGISAAPTVMNGVIYFGSRDGSFYAVNTSDGSLKWKYDTRDPIGTFSQAPIISSAVVSEDGSTVLFGAENMYFYALNTSNGSEKWAPKKVIGQSFLYSLPVVKGNNVYVRTMSSLGGAEYLMESVLDGLPANPDWQTQEKPAVNNWLAQNPGQRSMYVFDVNSGNEPFQVAMSRVSGENFSSFPPVVDNQNRLLTYWRSRTSTFFSGNSYGTKYCPDVSALDQTTGDRINLSPGVPPNSFCPELDNGFALTIGGNYMYLDNHFRGDMAINMTNGNHIDITHSLATQDCGGFRGYPYQVIYYGNDGAPFQTGTCTLVTDPRPSQSYSSSTFWSGVSIAATGATNMFYSNEADIEAIVGVSGGH